MISKFFSKSIFFSLFHYTKTNKLQICLSSKIEMPNHRAKIAGSERIRIKEVNLVARRVAQAHTQIKMVKVHVKLVLLLSIKHQTDSPDVRIVRTYINLISPQPCQDFLTSNTSLIYVLHRTGKYNPNTGRASCYNCPGGQYQDQNYMTGCKHCGHGTYQNQNTQTGCKGCQGGQYVNQYVPTNTLI